MKGTSDKKGAHFQQEGAAVGVVHVTRQDLPPVHVLGLGLPGPARRALFELPQLRLAQVLVAGPAVLAELEGHPAQKLTVDADLAGLVETLRRNRQAGKRQTVLCNGDPLFFGLGSRLAVDLGPEALVLHPGLSSLQAAAALLGRPWHNLRAVSLHGRNARLPLAQALMEGAPVFLLTDAANHPAAIAAWLRERGLEVPALYLLENLRQTADGRVCAARCLRLSLDQALELAPPATGALQVLLLEAWPGASRPCFGLPDEDFARDKNLISRLPVRAVALALLGIEPGHLVWDLGSGSGALAVEASFLARRGRVLAVERNERRLGHMMENRRRFGAGNMTILAGSMPDCLPDPDGAEPRPDRIFVGGGLGGGPGAGPGDKAGRASAAGPGAGREEGRERGDEILRRAWSALKPGGRLLAACVLLGSLERARTLLASLGAGLSVTCVQASRSAALGGDLRLEAQNPVFLVLAEKNQELP